MTRARDLADGADKDITGTLTLDDIVLSNDMSVADNGKVQFGAGDLQIYHDTNNSYIDEQGTGNLLIRGTEIQLKASDGTSYAEFNDGGATNLRFSGDLKFSTASTGVDIIGGFTATAASTITTTGNEVQLTLKSTDADAVEGPTLDLIRDSASPAAADNIGLIRFLGDDSAGNNTVYAEIHGQIENPANGSEDAALNFEITKGSSRANSFKIAADEVVVNDASRDVDFRVESDGNTHALFVDAAQNTVGIGTNSTFQNLTVNGNIAVGGSGNKGIYFGDNITSSADQEWLLANNASSSNAFILYEYDSGTYVSQRVEFLSGGNTRFDNASGTTLVINEAGNNADFRVESDNNSNMLFVDAGNDKVGMGHNAPNAKLDIMGQGTSATNLSMLIGADEGSAINPARTNNTDKACRIGLPHRETNEEPAALLLASSTAGSNAIYIGGGTSVMNAATQVNIVTADNSTTTSGVGRVQVTGSNMVVNDAGGDFDFRVESDGQSHALFVDAGTNAIGINTSNPGALQSFAETTVAPNFKVNSLSETNGPYFLYDGGGVFMAMANNYTSGTRFFISFGNSSTTRYGDITSNGSVMTYGGTSDYRLKTNVQSMSGSIDRVKQLNPVTFDWISSGVSTEGFIAHELQSVVPDAATGVKDEVDGNGQPIMQQVDPRHVVPLLTSALKEAISKIEALETRVAALEAN